MSYLIPPSDVYFTLVEIAEAEEVSEVVVANEISVIISELQEKGLFEPKMKKDDSINGDLLVNYQAGKSAATRQKLINLVKSKEQQLKTKQHTYIHRLENNYMQVPEGHFSTMTEVHKVFHEKGYSIDDIDPNKHPDNSAGRVFAKNVDPTIPITYDHYTGNLTIRAKAYPEELLPKFYKFLREDWFEKYGKKFLKQEVKKLTCKN